MKDLGFPAKKEKNDYEQNDQDSLHFLCTLVSNDIGSVLVWIADNNNYNEYLFIYAKELLQV